MATAMSGVVTVGPWFVALAALVLLFLGYAIWVVRKANSKMVIRLWKVVIERGELDPPSTEAPHPPQLRSVDPPEPDDEQSARPG